MSNFTLISPIRNGVVDTLESLLEKGIAYCASGGGYRAMLFQVGSLWRLNEAGILSNLRSIVGVSGSSITIAWLGVVWNKLEWAESGAAPNFKSLVADPLCRLAGRTIENCFHGTDVAGLPTLVDNLAYRLDRHLFSQATLQDLPGEQGPRIAINATNVQTGSLWTFSRRRMGDINVGFIPKPRVLLARAVAAASALPASAPETLVVNPEEFDPDTRGTHYAPPMFDEALLSDGGVYDPLALETTFRNTTTLLVCNASQKPRVEAEPPRDSWGHAMRMVNLLDVQVRGLRKRQLIHALTQRERTGAYWDIGSHFADYNVSDLVGLRKAQPCTLAALPTRFQRLESSVQERLINWGYAICDAALRKHCMDVFQKDHGIQIKPPKGLPYAGSAI